MWNTIVELLKLTFTATVGGLIAAAINQRTFQTQTRFMTKYHDKVKQREALRDILSMLPVINMVAYHGWKTLTGTEADERENMLSLRGKISTIVSLFTDDAELTRMLNTLANVIGTSSDSLTRSGVESPIETIDRMSLPRLSGHQEKTRYT